MEFLEKEDLTLTQPAFTPQGAKNQTSGSHTRRYAWNARSPLLASEEDFRERGRAVRFWVRTPGGVRLRLVYMKLRTDDCWEQDLDTILALSSRAQRFGHLILLYLEIRKKRVQGERKNARVWVENYMDVFHTSLLLHDSTVYMILSKYNKFKKHDEQYFSLKMLGWNQPAKLQSSGC